MATIREQQLQAKFVDGIGRHNNLPQLDELIATVCDELETRLAKRDHTGYLISTMTLFSWDSRQCLQLNNWFRWCER
jgi:hypothetical protein